MKAKARPTAGLSSDKRWMMMLAEYLPRCHIRLPENPNILNVGCGNSVKWNYLGAVLYLSDQGLGYPNYVAVDLSEDAFEEARRALDGLVHFVAGDARNLSGILTGTYRLAIFEHPNLSTSRDGSRIWQQVFEETGKLLDADGGIVLTSFWLNDHIPAQFALVRAGYEIAHSGTNKFPGKRFDTSSSGEALEFDKYIIVAKKPSEGVAMREGKE